MPGISGFKGSPIVCAKWAYRQLIFLLPFRDSVFKFYIFPSLSLKTNICNLPTHVYVYPRKFTTFWVVATWVGVESTSIHVNMLKKIVFIL
jgi:hypothetical protein